MSACYRHHKDLPIIRRACTNIGCQGKLPVSSHLEPKNMQDYKEEMSMKQWLALLMRTRGGGQLKSGGSQEREGDTEVQAVKLGLQGFARRQEERKKKGYEGDYQGYLPPAEEGGEGGSPG
jgi:hypothetical protein